MQWNRRFNCRNSGSISSRVRIGFSRLKPESPKVKSLIESANSLTLSLSQLLGSGNESLSEIQLLESDSGTCSDFVRASVLALGTLLKCMVSISDRTYLSLRRRFNPFVDSALRALDDLVATPRGGSHEAAFRDREVAK